MADFKPHNYVIVGTKHENLTFLRHAYSGLNEQKQKVKDYYFAVEFATPENHVLGGDGDPLRPGPGKTTKRISQDGRQEIQRRIPDDLEDIRRQEEGCRLL